MDLQGFFSAIFADWVALMSGIASVVLTILGVVRKWDTLPRRVLLIAALVCFFFAAARVWTGEHRARLLAESHLEELTKPKLSCEFGWVIAGNMIHDPVEAPIKEQPDLDVLAALIIKNLGAPSIAKAFTATVILSSGRTIEGNMRTVPNKVTMQTPQGEPRTFFREDALYDKAYSPIQKGSEITGTLNFRLAGTNNGEFFKPGGKLIIRFMDVTGKGYECIHPMSGGGQEIKYLPGMKSPL